jgi:hypothetical protein
MRFLFTLGNSRPAFIIYAKGAGFYLIVSEEVCFVPDIANLEKQSFVVKMLLKVVVAK